MASSYSPWRGLIAVPNKNTIRKRERLKLDMYEIVLCLGGFQNKDINKNMCQQRLESKESPLQSHAQIFENMCIHTSDQVAECQSPLKAEGGNLP